MFYEECTKRIGISNLIDPIFSHQAGHVYYGACCAADDDTDVSSHGYSLIEEVSVGSAYDDTLYCSPTQEHKTQPLVGLSRADSELLPTCKLRIVQLILNWKAHYIYQEWELMIITALQRFTVQKDNFVVSLLKELQTPRYRDKRRPPCLISMAVDKTPTAGLHQR
jgi:hypothetical protein